MSLFKRNRPESIFGILRTAAYAALWSTFGISGGASLTWAGLLVAVVCLPPAWLLWWMVGQAIAANRDFSKHEFPGS